MIKKMNEKQTIKNLKNFCRSFGKYSDWFGDKRKAPPKVRFYTEGSFYPSIGVISILDPYLDPEKMFKQFKSKFPNLRFIPDFIAGNKRIEVSFPSIGLDF